MVRRTVLGLLVLLAASPGGIAPHAVATAASNPVQIENAKPGTAAWRLSTPAWASGAIEGYASLTSVNRGGQISFFVNTADPSYTIEFYRLGYYGGLGGRLLGG